MAIKDMSPEEVQNAIDTGYRTAANVFLGAVEVLEERYGKAEAHEVALEIVRRKALASGEAATAKFGKRGVREPEDCPTGRFP